MARSVWSVLAIGVFAVVVVSIIVFVRGLAPIDDEMAVESMWWCFCGVLSKFVVVRSESLLPDRFGWLCRRN